MFLDELADASDERLREWAGEVIAGYLQHRMTDFQVANRLANERKYEEAFALFVRFAEANPDQAAKAYTRAGECARYINTLKEPVQVHPAVTLVRKGDHETAIRMFRLALQADPRYSKALKRLAQLLPDKSEEKYRLLTEAVAVQPDYMTWLALGDYNRSIRKDNSSAYECYVSAQKHNPRDKGSYLKLIDICKRLGRPDEASLWSKRWKEMRK